ncbi:hypothetical protein GOP47_0026048 [Adiantum capillus-veneris]|uniref:Pentatricopeptide repeat-containing protein n=1 Tax=Adiantum capillus-veneris TaxID=13818 RepID=A0A9D4U3I3_ADICA|nr:hypothetical protein GOP47_0026048 [Adiantum capillus-veneris]
MHICTCSKYVCSSPSVTDQSLSSTHTKTLCVYDWSNSCWVREELKGRESMSSTGYEEYACLRLQSVEIMKRIPAESDNEAQEAEQSLIGNGRNQQRVAQHICGLAKSIDEYGHMAYEGEAVHENKKQNSQQYNAGLGKSFVASLKVCARHKDLQKGSKLHTEILQYGLLKKNEFVGSALVSMYAKCGALDKAQEVFDQLPVRTAVVWNSLITGYTQQGLGREALNCYEQMQSEGFSPDSVTFACILKACGSIGALHKGQQLHTQIKRLLMLDEDVVVVSALVDMYAKCGALERAQEIFDEFSARDVVSWNALIAGYVQHGHGKEVLKCFEQMQLGGFSPNAVTFACTLKACGYLGALDRGQELHAQIMRDKLPEKGDMVNVALVDMYAKCGALEKAQEVFDEFPSRTIVAWNVLIAGYAQHGYGEEALHCFEQMKLGGFSPDATVFASALKACSCIGAFDKGEKLHAQIMKEGLLETDLVVANALIDMYAKCDSLRKAHKVFDELTDRNVVSWTALIAGYAQHGYSEEALSCYRKMLLGGFCPDMVTIACVLKACGRIGDLDTGQRIHAWIEKDSSLKEHVAVANAIVDMYAKCGAFAKAQEVFDKLLVQDKVSWTALIAGYTEHGLGEQAIKVFEWMQVKGISSDAVTFTWVLKACSSMGASYKGQEVHGDIVRFGLMEDDVIPGTVLLVMYAECGMLEEAQYLFDRLSNRDVVSWSALMAGYAQLGKDDIVFSLFDKMLASDIKPNSATLTVILSTCSHGGQPDKVESFFKLLVEGKRVVPSLEHHNCMIDIFSRAGLLENAIALIELMPFLPNQWLWHTLLGACQTGAGLNFGLWAFHHAVQLDEDDTAAYVSMSNIHGVAIMDDS